MTTQQRRIQVSRLAIAGAFLLTGLAGTMQIAVAGPPYVDNGGSGSGNATTTATDRPIFLEHFGLVATNDPSAPITGNTRIEGPSLVGSGPEREIVADADEVPTLVGSGPDREIVADADEVPTLVGSGPEREIVADSGSQQIASTIDETQRSIAIGSVLVGPQTASSTLDESARAGELGALQAGGTIALSPTEARHGQPF